MIASVSHLFPGNQKTVCMHRATSHGRIARRDSVLCFFLWVLPLGRTCCEEFCVALRSPHEAVLSSEVYRSERCAAWPCQLLFRPI